MIRRLALVAARSTPECIKRWVHRHRLLGRLSRKTFSVLARAEGEVVEIPSGPMRGIRLALGEHVSHAHIAGTYEVRTLAAIDALVRPGCVCYDLGASIGYMSLLMARKARHVYAFEPAPHAAAEIRRQAAVNGFDNITVVPSPVSDCEKTVTFSLTDVAYGSAIVDGESKWPTLKLTTLRLDDFVRANPAPDFLKIDVEGEEARVLLGAASLLEQHGPAICCELHSNALAEEVVSILTAHGYRLSALDGGDFRIPERIVAGSVHVVARSAVRRPD